MSKIDVRTKVSKLLFLLLTFALSCSAGAGVVMAGTDLGNGINAEIYSPDYIRESMIEEINGIPILLIGDQYRYELIPGVDDPAILNKGDGRFHPVKREDILRSLKDIDLNGIPMEMDVEIYILPWPRRFYLRSTAIENRIFLSPGVYHISSESTAFTVTHEFGHCFANRYLQGDQEERWKNYLEVRGLAGDYRFSSNSVHRNRPAELFAEDFRYLFGGAESNYSGTIENPQLPPPDQVPGLEEFFVSLVGEQIVLGEQQLPDGNRVIKELSNYPNPFNPSTSIKTIFDGNESCRTVDIKIYSADGSLVKNLFNGNVYGDELTVEWNGRDSKGRVVNSGVYFCRVSCKGTAELRKLIVIR